MTSPARAPAGEVAARQVPAWAFGVIVVLGATLRFWDLGHGTLSADESYSGVVSHLPVGQIWGYIDRTDPHPPLSYLILSPFSHLWPSTTMVRLPAATFGVLALVVFAWWQQRQEVAGLVATAVFAASPFLLDFSRQARMYGLLTLAAVVMAAAADRWWRSASPRYAAVAGVSAFVMAMSYSGGFVMPFALALVPGRRNDREAWHMRAAAGLAALGWAALWGAHTLHWSRVPSDYPSLSLSWVSGTLNDTIAPVPSDRWLVLGLLTLGSVIVLRRRDSLRQVVVALGLIPAGVLLVASLHNDVFIPKTMILFAWVPPVLLGAVAGEAWRLRPILAGLVVAVLVLVTVPYISTTMSSDEGAGSMVAAVTSAARPGDAIAMDPPWLATLLDWYAGAVPGRQLVADRHLVPGALVYRRAGESWTGRVWLVRSKAQASHDPLPPRSTSCGPERDVGGGYTLQCVALTGANS